MIGLLTAITFLTILPLPGTARSRDGGLGWFPAVGLLIGLMLAGVDLLLTAFSLPVRDALIVISLAVVTGAAHLDGLIDTCDGLGGQTAPGRLAAMRDSRVGAFGVVGAVSLLLLKYAALSQVPTELRTVSLVLGPVCGRWAVVWAVRLFPSARPDGLGHELRQRSGWRHAALASVIAVGSAFAVAQTTGVTVLILSLALGLIVAACLRRRFAGLSGDCYGSIIEVVETAVWVVMASAWV